MKYVGVKALHTTHLPGLVALGVDGGALLYLLVERPLQGLVKRWNRGRGPTPTAVSAWSSGPWPDS